MLNNQDNGGGSNPVPKSIMTPKDLAEYIQVPLSWVYNNIHTIPHVKLGRLLRFKKADIDKWLDDQSVKPFDLKKTMYNLSGPKYNRPVSQSRTQDERRQIE